MSEDASIVKYRRNIRKLFARIQNHVRKRRLGVVKRPKPYSSLMFKKGAEGYHHEWAPDLLYYPRGKASQYNKRNGRYSYYRVPKIAIEVILGEGDYFESATKAMQLLVGGSETIFDFILMRREIHVFKKNHAPVILKLKDECSIFPDLSFSIGKLFPEPPPESEIESELTLFDADMYGPESDFTDQIRLRQNNSRVPESEREIFNSVIEYEIPQRQPTTYLAGPLVMQLAGEPVQNLEQRKKPLEIGRWIESDQVKFSKCTGTGILFIEKHSTFHFIIESNALRELNLVLVCGQGIPRANTRRILHWLATQFKLPVYVLADNDTWGYYIFSILKRGAVVPHIRVPEMAIEDVRYLGVRAGDVKLCHNPRRLMISWKKYWDLRLRAMSKYDCFKSTAWRKEFAAFREQAGKVDIDAIVGCMKGTPANDYGARFRHFVRNYILKKLQDRDWLT